jgi:ABC transport system ATP-binding/permease protein
MSLSMDLVAMTESAAPELRVWYDGSAHTFVAGGDVVVGRDIHADVRIPEPLISRAHLVLRFEQGRWVAIDNDSLNGMYVQGRRVGAVDLDDGRHINVGSLVGPLLTFEVGAKESADHAPPSAVLAGSQQTALGPAPRHAKEASSALVTSLRKIGLPGTSGEPPPGSTTIGRADNNDIVVSDLLASRRHATLVPTAEGTEIRDAHSINGTFVNGSPVDQALLHDGDVVTIGNVDLVFSGGTLVRRSETQAATRTGGLDVQGLGWTIEDNKTLLDNVSFSAAPGTLTAVIGPSGAGKSTLAKLIAGYTQPTTGTVSFEGHNIHAEYASLRSRIGMVPQDDVVHHQLTVNQALGYAAELRLPPDTSKDERREVVARVLEELDLTQQATSRVDKLSGGQRKRASVAMELLTGPSLLLLDEPTSGLDPALDRQVMTMLRQLADAGRVVLVVTHSLSYLDVCDHVLLLAPGGKTAFCGPPNQIGPAMGTTNWADIFAAIGEDPHAAHLRFLERVKPPPQPPQAEKPANLGGPTRTSLRRQFSTITRRQVRLITADRGYFTFLAVLPFILGTLSLAVPGDTGLGYADPHGTEPDEPLEILILLNLAAVFMGTALTIRDLVGERAIFRREQAAGLSASAYLAAKITVYSIAALTQIGVLTWIMIAGKGAPTRGAVILGNPTLELYVTLAATGIVSAMLGLALSSLARSTEQLLPMLVVTIMVSMVLAGGLIPVTGRPGLSQASWLLPARWGFAASASTVDLRAIEPLARPDRLWEHSLHFWVLDMGVLTLMGVVITGLVRFWLRLPTRPVIKRRFPAVKRRIGLLASRAPRTVWARLRSPRPGGALTPSARRPPTSARCRWIWSQ